MNRTYKTKPVAIVYDHTELCYTCGKEGQTIREQVYINDVPRPIFYRSGIPVKWISSYDGVYCSEKCFAQSGTKKEQQNA